MGIWRILCVQGTRPKINIGCLWSSGPQTALHYKQTRFFHGNHYTGSRNRSEITVCVHSSLNYLKMQVKVCVCKEEHMKSLGQCSFKVKTVIRWAEIWNSFWEKKNGCCVLHTKGDMVHLAWYQCSVQKAWISDSMRLHECSAIWQLAHLERQHNAERYMQVLEQHTLPFWKHVFQERPWIFEHDKTKLEYSSY